MESPTNLATSAGGGATEGGQQNQQMHLSRSTDNDDSAFDWESWRIQMEKEENSGMA